MAYHKKIVDQEQGGHASRSLAINGGNAAVSEGPPSWPSTDDFVQQALEAAWSDGSWGRYLGHHCDALRSGLSDLHEVEHVLLCCSGTYAVEAALRGLAIGPGDEVILGAYDFPGNFRAIEAVGGRPVLVDIDHGNGTLDPALLDSAFGPSTRGVVVSHLHSGLVPMRRVMAWAEEHGVAVIEDACQAPGATVDGRMAATWGDAGILSFGGSKLLTAGRGGALLTRRTDLYQRAKVYGHRGNDAFPLSELQAAVLLPQLQVLAERNRKRQENVTMLLRETASLGGLRPMGVLGEGNAPSYTKVAWQLSKGGRFDRAEWLAALQAEGVAIDVGFRGFAERSVRRCRQVGSLAHSRAAAERTTVLHHPVLLEDREVIAQVVEALTKVATAFAS